MEEIHFKKGLPLDHQRNWRSVVSVGELERGDSGEIPTERVAELSSSCHHLESEEGTAPPHSDRWHLVGSQLTRIFFFIFITTPEGHVGVHFGDIIISIQSGTENRLIILLVLALAQLALSTLDLLFFSGSGASTLARELEPPRPWLDVGAN